MLSFSKKNMKKKLKFETQDVRITKTDLRNAKPYTNTKHCLLCTAMRRLGFKSVVCAGGTVDTSLGKFEFDDENKLLHAYDHQTHETIRKDAKPFSVRLIPA